jgi:predicted transcriptional regulator
VDKCGEIAIELEYINDDVIAAYLSWALKYLTSLKCMVDYWLYFCYTIIMKTAVSLPDQLYQEAEKTARSMGIPRSQLFARALEDFIALHKRENITEKLNRVYAEIDQNEFQAISNASVEAIRNFTKNDTW